MHTTVLGVTAVLYGPRCCAGRGGPGLKRGETPGWGGLCAS